MSQSGFGVQVELGPCRVVRDEKGKFTTYTLHFRIAEETHIFTSRYAKLYKFHEQLLKNEDFQKSFNYNPPDFPPKSWFTDFTKPKNYKKRANKVLKYFKILTSRPSILRNKQFQRGIDLPQNLQKLISQIAKGLQSKKFIEKNYNKKLVHSPHSHSNSSSPKNNIINKNMDKPQRLNQDNNKNEIISIFNNNESIKCIKNNKSERIKKDDIMSNMGQQQQILNKKGMERMDIMNIMDGNKQNIASLETLLKDLENKTDKMFIDIVDGMDDVEIKENIDEYGIDDKFINNMNIFCIHEILPKHLMDINNKSFDGNSEKMEINMNLFNIMNERDIDEIDDIALDIRDAIITACEISVN